MDSGQESENFTKDLGLLPSWFESHRSRDGSLSSWNDEDWSWQLEETQNQQSEDSSKSPTRFEELYSICRARDYVLTSDNTLNTKDLTFEYYCNFCFRYQLSLNYYDEKEEKWKNKFVFKGSGKEKTLFTCVLCLPLLLEDRETVITIAGGDNGQLTIFSINGVKLIQQTFFDEVPIISIKSRMNDQNDTEITIVYYNGNLVSITGLDLATSIQKSLSGTKFSSEDLTFTFKKWSLNQPPPSPNQKPNQSKTLKTAITSLNIHRTPSTPSNNEQHLPKPFVCVDGLSLGPSILSSPNQSSNYFSSELGSTPYNRFLVVGQPSSTNVCFSIYASTDPTKGSIINMATKFLSLAKSFWGDQKADSSDATQAPTSSVHPWHHFVDLPRHIQSINLSPPSNDGTRLICMSDTLGRVLLLDVESGDILRMWKGARDAQCGWLTAYNHKYSQIYPNEPPLRKLFLVIYYSKRGQLEVYRMRSGKKVKSIRIGLGWRLLNSNSDILSSVSPDTIQSTSLELFPFNSFCFLLNPKGRIYLLTQPYHNS